MADAGRDPWPDKPDRWQQADEEWQRWGEDEEPLATALPRAGPRPEPLNPVQAYARGMMEAGPYLHLGFQIAGAMAVFTGGGYVLDRWLGTSPWGIITGAVLAFTGIIVLVVRLGKTANRGHRAE